MRHISSRLTHSGASALFVSGALLVLVLCACALLTNHLVPRYGTRVRPAESHFIMGSYDRSLSHIVTILPGDTPRLYAESTPLADGLNGFAAALDSWTCDTPGRVTVILVIDEAVSAGTVQRAVDMILAHGFNCSFSGTPATE